MPIYLGNLKFNTKPIVDPSDKYEIYLRNCLSKYVALNSKETNLGIFILEILLQNNFVYQYIDIHKLNYEFKFNGPFHCKIKNGRPTVYLPTQSTFELPDFPITNLPSSKLWASNEKKTLDFNVYKLFALAEKIAIMIMAQHLYPNDECIEFTELGEVIKLLVTHSIITTDTVFNIQIVRTEKNTNDDTSILVPGLKYGLGGLGIKDVNLKSPNISQFY